MLHFETVGDFSADEMHVMNRLQQEVAERHGYALIFINNREPGLLSADARRVAIENNRKHADPWSMALIGFEGARATVARAAVLLAAHGIRLLTGRRFYLEFFANENLALSWLETERQRHRSERRGKA